MSRLFGDSNNINNNNNNNKDRSNWFNKDFLRGRAFSRSNSSQPNSDSESDDDNNPTTSRREQLWNSLSSNVENFSDRVFKKDQDLNANAFEAQSLDSPTDNPLIGQVKQVNGRNLKILEQIAEGSTAFLYLVAQIDNSSNLQEIELKGDSLLKILYSPTPEALSLVEREVDFMSQLNHPNIVKFFGSETSPKAENGINMGFETLIWMEYCQEGNLVDLMNSRISTKFAEAEILYMFCDIIQGVGFMHLSSPQIVHRDLKVENVLISKERKFKLCDFGSCTTRIVPPRTQLTMQQIHSLEEDIQKNTTLQYRAPEMIDLFLRKGLTEKTDIWALGVLLYKLCYFITPFEENGQLAILNCRYDFPQLPQYSDGIKSLISSMLQEDPEDRPNIVEVCERVCQLRKVPCPLSGFENVLKDQESSQKSTIPAESRHRKSNSVTEDVFNIAQQKGPEMNINTEAITPMRRGRPKKNASVQLVNSFNPSQPQSNNLKDLSSEFSNSDPFAALVQESEQKSSSSISNDNQNWGSNQATSSSQEFDPFSLLAQGQAASIQNSNNGDLLGTNENISTQRRLPRPPSIDNMNPQSNNYANRPPQRPPRRISNDEKTDSAYTSFGSQLPRPPSGEFTKPSSSNEDLLLGSTQRRLPRRPSGDIKQSPNSFSEPPPKPAQRTLPRAPSGEFEASTGRVDFSNTNPTERILPRPPSNEDLINSSNHSSNNNLQQSRPKASRFDSFEHDDEEEDSLLSTGGYSNLNDEEPFASFEDNDPYNVSQLKQTLPPRSRHASSKSLPPPIPPKPPSLSILDNLSNSPLSPTHPNKPPPIPPKPRNLQ